MEAPNSNNQSGAHSTETKSNSTPTPSSKDGNRLASGGDTPKKPKGSKTLSDDQEVAIKPYFAKTKEVCYLLGGISPRTLRRLVERNFIHPVRMLRHNMFLLEDVHTLAMNLKEWNA